MQGNKRLEDVKARHSMLDFRQNPRIALVDGQIKESKSISEPVKEWLREVCQLYLESDDNTRYQLRSLLDNDDELWSLMVFAQNCGDDMQRSPDPGKLELGLAALAIENRRFDARDFVLVLNALLRAARKAGVVVNGPLEDVAAKSGLPARSSFLDARR